MRACMQLLSWQFLEQVSLWQHFSSVSWTDKYFLAFLYSTPLHGLELISFFGNTWQREPLFLGPIYKYFCGFFAFQTPACIGAD